MKKGQDDTGLIVEEPEVNQVPTITDDYESEIEIEGQKQKVKYGELKAGYMKDADYRKKTSEVSEQRKQLDADMAELVEYRNIANWFEDQGNIEKAKKIRAIIQGKEEAIEGDDPDDPYFKRISEVEKRAIAAEQKASQLEQTYSARELQKNISEVNAEKDAVKVKYPDFTDEDMQYVNDMAVARLNRGEDSNLVKAADDLVKRLKSYGEKHVNDYLSGKEKDAENSVEIGSLPPPPLDRKISLEGGEGMIKAKDAFRETLKQAIKQK